MEEFITWEMLGDFALLASIVLTATQFVKNAPIVKKLNTKYLAWTIAFILIVLTHVHVEDFKVLDIVLYALSAMFVSTSASGIYDIGSKKDKLPIETTDIDKK